jgi:hypothetical protein
MSEISPQQKKDPQKRERKEQGLKRKRGETSIEMLHVLKKKSMKFTSCWEGFYQKKE